MAEKKEFEVRLCQLKKTHAEWMAVTTPLENGELVLTTGANVDGVAVLAALVGDGTSTYAQLYTAKKYLCAPASDVYAWAKAATKPEYKASEIKELATYIATELGKLDVTDTAVDGQYVSAVSETDGKITVSRKAFADLAGVIFAAKSHTHLSDEITMGQPQDQAYAEWFGVTVTEVLEELLIFQTLSSDRFDDAERAIGDLYGDDTYGKSVRTIAAEELAKQLIPQNADAARDTLQEIAAWIQSHPGDASAMNASITALQALLVGIEDYDTVVDYVDAAISALKIGDYAKAADLTALATRVSTLEGKAHTHTNKSVLDDITAEKVAAWDAKPDTSDLAAIAFSGSTDDLVQGEKTIILRCTI